MRTQRPPGAGLLLVIVVVAALLAGCTGEPAVPGPAAAPPTPAGATPNSTDPAALAARLSDEDLVGQVLMPYAFGTDAQTVSGDSASANQEYAGVSTPVEMIAKYRLGGLILMRRTDDATAATNLSSNIESPEQLRRLTTGLQGAARTLPAGLPMFIGTDQEFGTVTRIREGVTQLPSALAFGAAADATLTQRAWQAAGEELAALGVNVNFAPVADVLGAADGGVIGSRSFGSDPKVAGDQVAGAVRGLQAAGVAATLKHFPGHGHTTTDSHTDLPVLPQSRASLDSGDLPPFRSGIAAGTWLVMSGHLDVRSVDAGVPATFSPKVLTDVLRTQLGYTGVVVTDAMNMEPAMAWPPGEAAVRALLAGNDLLLMPPDLGAAYAGILDAVKSGRLPRAQLVASVTRLLTVKVRLAGFAQPAMSVLGGDAHQQAARALAAAAVTVFKGACQGALVRGPVTVTASAGREAQRDALANALASQGVQVVPSGGAVVHLTGYGDTADDLRTGAAVTVSMDTPYLLSKARSPVLLATYSSSDASVTALAAVLAGKARPTGRSPVPVSGLPATTCGR